MNLFYGILIGVLFVFAISIFFKFVYYYGLGIKEKEHFFNKYYKMFFALFIFFGFILCLYIILQNKFVYYWDYGGYWTMSYNTMNKLFENPFDTLKSVYESILYDDYNYLLPFFISLYLRCFGYTFSRYVMINYMIFLVPALIILVSIVWKTILIYHPEFKLKNIKYLWFVFTIFLAFTFSPFYYAMLHGYIDVACMIPSLLAVLLFMDYDILSFNRKQLFRNILIATNLLISLLFRRYFAYFIVGYCFTLFIYAIYKIIESHGSNGWIKKIYNAILNLFILGAFSLSIILIFFKILFLRLIKNNYSIQYQAYDYSLIIKLMEVVKQFGIITIVIICISVICSLIFKKARKITLFSACSILITIVSFWQVQIIGQHHLYTIAGEACILMILGIYQIIDLIDKMIYKIMIVIISLFIFSIGIMNVFFPTAGHFINNISELYAQKYYPMQRNDIEQLHDLVNFLNDLTYGTDKHVYVCASGGVLNADIIKSANKPYTSKAVNNMYDTSDIDLRDGFSTDFLYADYIVVTNPVELHAKEGTQEVVRFLCEEVKKSNSPIGRHFVKMNKTYILDRDIIVYIYKKISDFDKSDYQYLADYYDNYYPGMNEMFSDRIWKAFKE